VRAAAFVTMILLCGCVRDEPPREMLCECFAQAAYACAMAESASPDGESPEKPCCGQCNGTGKVLSGDKLALVDCECDPSCPCKSKSCGPGGSCKQ